jgi:nitroreductase
MSRIDAAPLADLAALANRAPSVHNTQPARFALDEEGNILIAADLSRHLSVGDPTGRDMGLSCGAALEGMAMALAARGTGVLVDDLWEADIRSWRPGYRLAARLMPAGEASPSPLADWTEKRFTWRDSFSAAAPEALADLEQWAVEADDITFAGGPDALAFIAALNDEASLSVMRERAFRDELVAWMRLTPAHPAYAFDGLNLDALRMGRLEGAVAGRVLASPLFHLADRLGLGKTLVAEAGKTMTAAACLLFHRPEGESPVVSGRAFYRFWLGFTRFGFAGWPMAVLADVPSASEALRQRFPLPPGHRLINVLRVGPAPLTLPKYRLPPRDLVLG